MLEGLEISEIKLSMLNEESRIDAEYFKKRYLHEDSALEKYQLKPIKDFAFISDGQHGYYEVDDSSNIHMLAARNAKNWFADLDDAIPLAKWVDDNNKRSSLEVGDLILSTRGTVGNCAIINEDVLPANLNQDVARIKITDKSFSPEFVLAFLNSCFGQDWLNRNQTGMVQQGIALSKLQSFQVPLLSADFQSKIAGIVKSAHAKLEESKSLYSQAENLLLSELGMSNPSEIFDSCENVNVSIKRFSDVFQSGRLDSEYYQKKYDLMEEKISHLETSQISEVGKLKDKNFSPEENAEYKYIELADIGRQGEISSCTVSKGSELPTRARRIVHKGDVLVSSIEGSLQSCAIVSSEFDGALCSTGFYVIEPEIINAESLLILLKSENIQLLLKKGCSGTILTNISKEEFLKIKIPVLPPEIQSKIASLVQSSFACRSESRQLMQNAKTLVEQEIEKQGEKIDEKKVAQINAVYDKVSEKEQISMSRSSMRSMWEAVKDDTW